MESNSKNTIPVEIPNYSGPLEVLLNLAKAQKVDLTKISITKLADQFLEYIKQAKNLNLELASEYLLMATWLAYLKSKLLLPEDEEEVFKAVEVAKKLKLQLKKLELIRLLSDQLIKKDRIGVNIFYRGMKGGIKSIYTSTYKVSLYELLKTYATIKSQNAFQTINIPKLPVLSTEEAINQLKRNLDNILDWKDIEDLIPKNFTFNKKMKKSGLAGIFSASLELTKQGITTITQKKLFETLFIRKLS
jgi:segregation and condensation protein A